MGKSTPSPPATPDPTTTASAQGQANVATATANAYLNNPNQVNPYGTSTTTQTGGMTITQPDGSTSFVPQFTVNQSLNAQQQHLLDQTNLLKSTLNDTATNALTSVQSTLSNPITSDQLGQIQTNIGARPQLQNSYNSGQLQTGYDPGGSIQTGYGTGPTLQYGYDSGGSVASGYDAGGAIQRLGDPTMQGTNAPSTFGQTATGIQSDVNLSTNSPTTFGQTANGVQYFQGQDFSAARDSATNAVLQRLAPQMAQQQESLNSSLANQGTAQGSAAWNAAQLSQNQANNDLRLGAVATGDNEQQALFGEQATANQLYNAAQSQDYAQQLGRGQFAQAGIAANNQATLDMGQFHNAAQQQDFGQLLDRANYAQSAYGMNNAAIAGNNQATLNYGAFNNAAQLQQNQENANAAAFSNSAQAQRNAQNASAAGFYNSTVGQQNQQNAAAAAFYDTAQAQQNAQNQQQAGFYNSTTGQQAQMNAALASFSNQAGQQDYQNRLLGANFHNQGVQQQLSQDMTLQNQQINEVSALMSGGQVASPNYSPYNTSTIDQTPISADTYQSAALQMQAYQAQLQNQAQNTAAFGSALGGLFGGLTKISDARLKSDVRRVGATSLGVPLYNYKLAGFPGRDEGVMAHEVALVHPDAVFTGPDGFARVDYSKVAA